MTTAAALPAGSTRRCCRDASRSSRVICASELRPTSTGPARATWVPAPAPSTILEYQAAHGSEPNGGTRPARALRAPAARTVLRSPTMRRAAVALTALVVLVTGWTAAVPASGAGLTVDARSRPPAAQLAAARHALRAALGRRALVALDARTGRARLLARRDGFLTGKSRLPPARVALGFVRTHDRALGVDGGDLAGLELVRAYRFGGGTTHLGWEQFHRGIPLFGAGLGANVAADGRLINITGAPRPEPQRRLRDAPSVRPRCAAGGRPRRAGDPGARASERDRVVPTG